MHSRMQWGTCLFAQTIRSKHVDSSPLYAVAWQRKQVCNVQDDMGVCFLTAPLFSRGFQRKPEGHPLRHFFFGSNLKKETHMFVAVYLSSSVELLLQLAWTSGSVRRIPIRMLQGLVVLVPFPLFFFVFRGSNGFYIQVFWVTESL